MLFNLVGPPMAGQGAKMDAKDIEDIMSFEAWLNTLPEKLGETEARRQAVYIANRAALRSFPIVWAAFRRQKKPEDGFAPLPALRCLLVASVGGVLAIDDALRIAAIAAAEANDVAAQRPVNDLATETVMAAYAATNCAAAAAFGSLDNSATSADSAAYALAAIAYAPPVYKGPIAANARAFFWKFVSADSAYMAQDKIFQKTNPLWPFGPPEGLPKIETCNDGEDWAFWIRWYDEMVRGEPQNWPMLREIALIHNKHWDAGATVVNPQIAIIQAKYAIAATPNAEFLERDPLDRLIRSVTVTTLEAFEFADTCDRVRDAVDRIKLSKNGDNLRLLDILATEINDLEDYLERYQYRPLRVYEVCIDVSFSIESKVRSGALPEGNYDIARFVRELERSATDILVGDTEVAVKVRKRASVRFARMNEAEKAALRDKTMAFAAEAKPALADELISDLDIAIDETASDEKKSDSRYQLGSRIMRYGKIRREEITKLADDAGKLNRGAQAADTLITWVAGWFV